MSTSSPRCHECGIRILRQSRLLCFEKGSGERGVGRLQGKVYHQYYNLDPVPSEPFDRLHAQPDYSEVIRVLTNGQGQWKLNSKGHAVHFQVKHLAY